MEQIDVNKNIIIFLTVSLIGSHAWAGSVAVPNTFVDGTAASAGEVNANFDAIESAVNDNDVRISSDFSELDNRLKGIEESNSYITAQIIGVDMQVSSQSIGLYSVITPTGLSLTVNTEGYPIQNQLYFESNDCSGQPYIKSFQLDSSKPVGYMYPNPKVNNSISIVYDGTNVYHSDTVEIIKLHYQSQLIPDTGCTKSSEAIIAMKALINDVAVTGITSFPLIITGVGSDLVITTEVGVPAGVSQEEYVVYASGVRIGVTHTKPVYSIRDVELDAYPGETINILKDGSYGGFTRVLSSTLYYPGGNCTGEPYVEVLPNYDTSWWSPNSTDYRSGIIQNNGSYYELSSEIYKMSQGAQSYRKSATGCISVSSTILFGYKRAILTNPVDFPVFIPPITADGFDEGILYDNVPEAF